MNRLDYRTCNWLALKINNAAFRNHADVIRGRVVDLGCGSAQYKQDILELADEYVGVDWENSLHNSKRVDLSADLSKTLPIDDEFADTVTAFQVMEHVPEPDSFLSECWRITKPGGALFLTVPFMWWVHEQPNDYFRYTRHGLLYLLEKHGYESVEVEETTGFWQMMVLKTNYYTARLAGPLRLFCVPFWFLGQVLAPLLDHLARSPEETASYAAVARKPERRASVEAPRGTTEC